MDAPPGRLPSDRRAPHQGRSGGVLDTRVYYQDNCWAHVLTTRTSVGNTCLLTKGVSDTPQVAVDAWMLPLGASRLIGERLTKGGHSLVPLQVSSNPETLNQYAVVPRWARI